MYVGEYMELSPVVWYRQTRQYLNDVQVEYKKITWPPQKEAVAGTVGVMVIVAIVATVLGVVDFLLSRVVQMILS